MAAFNLDYRPREAFRPFHIRKQQYAALVCHRRAGKTVACVYELVVRALYTKKKNARFAYIAPFYRQAKDVAWQYLKEATKGLAVEVRESDLRVILPDGQWITLYGADNPDALRGIYLDGVVLDEFGDCRPSLWAEVVLPTLMDRDGWAVFIGTPKGKNHFYHIVENAKTDDDWYCMILPASVSGILPEKALNSMKKLMEQAQYAQEMECDFTAAVKGTYYADIIQKAEAHGRIAQFGGGLYSPGEPVYAAMDLGRTDSTAIWFWQEVDGQVNVINYEEVDGMVIEDMIAMFREKPYTLEILWVPHDAKAKTVQTRRSSVEQFLDAGFNAQLVPSLSVQQGIDAARLMLPRIRIDSDFCYDGIEALRAYQREYDEKLQVFKQKPLHNWASDGADAFRYLALVANQKGATLEAPKPPPAPVVKPPEYRLNELFEAHEQGPTLSLTRRRI